MMGFHETPSRLSYEIRPIYRKTQPTPMHLRRNSVSGALVSCRQVLHRAVERRVESRLGAGSPDPR
jgi:hypothetical protein